MKGRSTDGGAAKDRRGPEGHRIQFEAMVAIGGAEGGAAFEAESVDVSSGGMRLRTAYLPKVGDQLVFRFDGPEGEVVAQAEVIWATEEQRGGEFAVKFLDLDDESIAALKSMCAPEPGNEPEAPDAPRANLRGTRVKLHIEGLASPMKARVKDGDDQEICVGSSLEFLKLGRHVEVEDVDHGERKEGFVDGVKVEIDPATSIPQLVVSLRFDAVMVGAPAPRPSDAAAKKPEAKASAASADAVRKSIAGAEESAPVTKVTAPRSSEAKTSETDSKVAAAVAGEIEDDEIILPPNRLRAAQEKAKEVSSMAASKIGPAFSKMGEGAKGIFGAISDKISQTKQARDEAKKAAGPRRVTAPPPSGALTSDGRRLVRQDQDESEAPPPTAMKKKNRRGMVIGASAGLALLIGVFGISRAMRGGNEAPQGNEVAARETKPAPQLPPIPGAAATAEVPLFGATPLSTTEQVTPPPANPATASVGEEGDEEAADASDAKPAKEETVREWGKGEVSSAKVLKIKMDGPIAGFVGKESEDGFTITVPGRKPQSSTGGLMRKDKRISALDVVPMETGTELTLHFKGEPPAYLAKVRGDRLEIALSGSSASSSDEPKKVANKKTSKKKSSKKKPAHD